MAVRSAQVSVTSTATLLVDPTQDDSTSTYVAIIRNTGVASVFLGDSSVTTAVGFELVAGATVSIQLAGEGLYGRTASGTIRVDVLREGVV